MFFWPFCLGLFVFFSGVRSSCGLMNKAVESWDAGFGGRRIPSESMITTNVSKLQESQGFETNRQKLSRSRVAILNLSANCAL